MNKQVSSDSDSGCFNSGKFS